MAALGVTAAWAAGDGAPFAGKWRIETVRGAGAFDVSRTLFEARADGQVATTVGCNRMIGKPVVDGNGLPPAARSGGESVRSCARGGAVLAQRGSEADDSRRRRRDRGDALENRVGRRERSVMALLAEDVS